MSSGRFCPSRAEGPDPGFDGINSRCSISDIQDQSEALYEVKVEKGGAGCDQEEIVRPRPEPQRGFRIWFAGPSPIGKRLSPALGRRCSGKGLGRLQEFVSQLVGLGKKSTKRPIPAERGDGRFPCMS